MRPRQQRLARAFALLALLLAGCAAPPPRLTAPVQSVPPGTPSPPTLAGLRLQPASFDQLPGWGGDDLAGAWSAWRRDCSARASALAGACAASTAVPADDPAAQRTFFEHWFQPWQASSPDGSDTGLVTGYYEPVLHGALQRGWPYVVPIYGLPADLVDRADPGDGVTRGRLVRDTAGTSSVAPFWSRAQIDADPQAQAALGRNVVVWLDDPVDALFLQVQGSGLVALPDGRTLRLSYAGDNGWPYRSVGRWLLDHGELRGTVTMQIIRAWAQMHPDRVRDMLDANPRVVFFSATPLVDAARGPTGAMGVPLTPLRSVAVDRRLLPLGTPVWLDTRADARPLQRLVFAQDVGGAIVGALRADLFFGTGTQAGDSAGRMQAPGRFWVLLPRTPAPPTS